MAPVPVGTAGAVVASPTTVATPTTLTPGTGSGYAVGDVLLCFTACRSPTPTVATPGGWTQIVNVTGTNGRLALFAKRATSTTEAAPSVVWSNLTTGNSGTPVEAVVAAFTGLSAGTLTDVVGVAADGAASTTASAGGAAITTLTPGDLVLSLTTRLDDAFTTFDKPTGFTNVTPAMGTTSGLDMSMAWAWQFKAAAGAVTAPNFVLTGASSFASSGVMVALKPVVTGVPANETSIDDFNRADGPIYAGAGASIWESVGTQFDTTTATTGITAGNQMASSSGSSGYYMRSKPQLQSDFDLLYDIATVGQVVSFFALTDIGTSVYDGYSLDLGSGIGAWILRYYDNGSPTTLASTISGVGPTLVAGCTIWIEKRGTTTNVYYRAPSGSQFVQVLTATDARNNVASPFVFQIPNTTARVDNLRGGAPPVLLNQTLLDDFNRSDGLVYAGAGASLWATQGLGVATQARVISNQLGTASAGTYQAFSLFQFQSDFDLLVDAVVAVSNWAIWFCIETAPSDASVSAFLLQGSVLPPPVWQLFSYVAGVSTSISSASQAGALAAGDTIWIAKRGSSLTVSRKPSGGSFAPVVSASSGAHASGAISVEMRDTTVRWDNVSGGPLVLASSVSPGWLERPAVISQAAKRSATW